MRPPAFPGVCFAWHPQRLPSVFRVMLDVEISHVSARGLVWLAVVLPAEAD